MDEIFVGFLGNSIANNGGGVVGIPASFGGGDSETKLYVDRYEVFVNGEKVGEKIQRTQVEDPEYLQSYLKDNGFEVFDYQVVGDHIEINIDQEAQNMKEILSSYLSIS